MLNSLKEKEYSLYELTDSDYVRFLFCLIFADGEFAKEVIGELTCLFAKIEKISYNHRLGLFLALKMMIKFRFGDDLKRKRELLEMVVKSVHASEHEKIVGFEEDQKTIEELKSNYAKLKAETDKALSDKDKALSDKDKALSDSNDLIDGLYIELGEKDKLIEKARNILKNYNIIL